MLRVLKNFLINKGVFYKLKYSRISLIYDRLFRKGNRKELIREISFYRSFLPTCRLIFDIGANDGHKTIAFLTMSDKVIACEPDPLNLEILKIRFPNKQKVVIEPLAVTNKVGFSSLYIHHPGSSLNTINPGFKIILESDKKNRWVEPVQYSGSVIPVNTTSLDKLIEKYGCPQFIKIDVEGNELMVLKGLSNKIPCISFEVLLPEFLGDAQEAMQLLTDLDKHTKFNYSVEEKLVLPEFISHDQFKELLGGLSIFHLEIIAKTSQSIS